VWWSASYLPHHVVIFLRYKRASGSSRRSSCLRFWSVGLPAESHLPISESERGGYNVQTSDDQPMQRFFAGITEYTFQAQLGVPDTDLIDYLTDLLTRFVRSDMMFRVRGLTGKPLMEVADMLIEAESRLGAAKRSVHQHVGDFLLFWSGVYPESLGKMQDKERKDHLLNYWAVGKKAYSTASELSAEEEEDGEAEVLCKLSCRFELCAYGLGEVRREWERRDPDGPTRIIVM